MFVLYIRETPYVFSIVWHAVNSFSLLWWQLWRTSHRCNLTMVIRQRIRVGGCRPAVNEVLEFNDRGMDLVILKYALSIIKKKFIQNIAEMSGETVSSLQMFG